MVLKLFSRTLGKLLISISILVFLTSFIALALGNNIDILKSSIDPEEILEEIMQTDSEMSLDEIKELCKLNPTEEGCDVIQDPSKLFDEQFDIISETISSNAGNIALAKTLSVVLFLVGIGLLYFGTSNIFATLYKTSLTTLFSTTPYLIILFYSSKLASTDLIARLAPQVNGQQFSQKFLEMTIEAVRAWFVAAIQELKPLLIILVGISLPATIIFFILKKKYPSKSVKDGDQNQSDQKS